MESIGLYSPYLGSLFLILTAVMATYFLLWGNVEIKRIVVFTAIMLFCGAFFLLYERMTELELSGLGKIKVQAIEDASEIRRALLDVKLQRDEINKVVEDANSLKLKIVSLESEFERKKVDKKIIISRIEKEMEALEMRNYKIPAELHNASMKGDHNRVYELLDEQSYLRDALVEKEKQLESLRED